MAIKAHFEIKTHFVKKYVIIIAGSNNSSKLDFNVLNDSFQFRRQIKSISWTRKWSTFGMMTSSHL